MIPEGRDAAAIGRVVIRRRVFPGALLALSLAARSGAVRAEHSRATELESRLFAPCCWVQTLDVHESELADSLRREIRSRLDAGESSLQIEDDMAQRFGERIRAVPRGQDPRRSIPALVGTAMLLAVASLFWLGLRWKRNRTTSVALASSSESQAQDRQYDLELDRELGQLSERNDSPSSS